MITIEELKKQKQYLIDYLLSKVSSEDWHAVQDAASDIREINAKIMILKLFEKKAELKEKNDVTRTRTASEKN